MNELTYLKQLPETLEQKKHFIEGCITSILDGFENPLLWDAHLKVIEETVSAIRNDRDVKAAVIEEFEKYGQKSVKFDRVTVTLKTRTTKHFNHIEDQTLTDLETQKKALDMQIKARKMVIESGHDPETGETFPGPQTSTTTFLSYEFEK